MHGASLGWLPLSAKLSTAVPQLAPVGRPSGRFGGQSETWGLFGGLKATLQQPGTVAA